MDLPDIADQGCGHGGGRDVNSMENVLMTRSPRHNQRIRMADSLRAVLLFFIFVNPAFAQTDVLIEVDRARSEGLFTPTPVYQRAILSKPTQPATIVLLYFRGNPGIAQIQSVADKTRNLTTFMRINEQLFMDEKIALVVMDCATDKWRGCPESYRLSEAYAEDVRSVIRVLKDVHGLTEIYLMGHSMGASSSRGLARTLGNEIAGGIHSAAMNVAAPNGFGSSFSGFAYDKLATPQLHIHNQNDACRSTPYWPVKGYAGNNLTTVIGGTAEGDPCGGGHLHSHQGREKLVVKTVIAWIKTKTVVPVIGE